MPPPRVFRLALRPWHVLSDHGDILEVVSDEAAARLRDDGYITIADPFDEEKRAQWKPLNVEDDGA